MNKKELWAKAAELVGEQELSRRFCNWCSSLIKKELVKRSESSADEFFLQQATAILNDLNRRAARHHRLNPETSKMILVLSGEAMPAVEEEYQRLKKQHADHADHADKGE